MDTYNFRPRIGVLALQGDFAAHIKMLTTLGVEGIAIRLPEQLEQIDGIIIPGGESTTIGKLMVIYNLQDIVLKKIQAGLPVWGTCAGLILLAKKTDNALAGQPLLASMDIQVRRNAFGSQREVLKLICQCPHLEKRHSTHSSSVVPPLKRLVRWLRCWRRSTMEPSSLSVKGPC